MNNVSASISRPTLLSFTLSLLLGACVVPKYYEDSSIGAGGEDSKGGSSTSAGKSNGGGNVAGGSTSAGGTSSTASASSTRVSPTSGGSTTEGAGVGGMSSAGDTSTKGGSTATGGTTSIGGTSTKGGSTATGGTTSIGGTSAKGGSAATGGTTSLGGSNATGGTTTATTSPPAGCDGPSIAFSSAIRTALGITSTSPTWNDVKSYSTLSLQSQVNPDLNGLQCLTGLRTLDLSYCQLATLDALPTLAELRALDISGNSLSNLSKLSGFSSLASLTVADNTRNENGLVPLSLLGVADLPSLTYLNAANSYVVSIAGLETHPTLQQVILDGNYITSLSTIIAMNSLTTLSLNSNTLASLSGLEQLTNLVSLSISSQSSSSPALGFAPLKTLKHLQMLDASNNALDYTDLGSITSLTHLDIGFGYRVINSAVFTSLKDLVELDVSMNTLTEVDGLAGLTKLNRVDLSRVGTVDIQGLVINSNSTPDAFSAGAVLWLSGTTVTDCADINTLKNNGVVIYGGPC